MEGHLLIAVDDRQLRRIFKTYLESLGHTVLVAADGEEALELFAAHGERIELVLLDSVLAGVSGPTAYEQMHRDHRGLPSIFVTGRSGELSRGQQGDDANVTVLRKPVTCRQVGWEVGQVLARRRAAGEV